MEGIKFVSYVFMDLIMISVMIYCYSKMSLQKINLNKTKIFIIILLSCLNIVNNLYTPVNFVLLGAYVIAIFINKVPFNIKYRQTAIYTAFYLVITYILELFLSLPLIFFNIDLTSVNSSIIIKYSLSILYNKNWLPKSMHWF